METKIEIKGATFVVEPRGAAWGRVMGRETYSWWIGVAAESFGGTDLTLGAGMSGSDAALLELLRFVSAYLGGTDTDNDDIRSAVRALRAAGITEADLDDARMELGDPELSGGE